MNEEKKDGGNPAAIEAAVTGLSMGLDKSGLHDLETGKPSMVTIDEDTGRWIQSAVNALQFMFRGPTVQVSDEQLQMMIRNLNIPMILLQGNVLLQNITPAIPYAQLVEDDFPRAATASLTLIKACEFAGIELPEDIATGPGKVTPEVASDIAQQIGWKFYAAQKIMNLFAWTFDDIKLVNRLDIAKRQAKKD